MSRRGQHVEERHALEVCPEVEPRSLADVALRVVQQILADVALRLNSVGLLAETVTDLLEKAGIEVVDDDKITEDLVKRVSGRVARRLLKEFL